MCHELVHDRQARLGKPVNHDFDDLEDHLEGLDPDIECVIKGLPDD